MVAVISILLIVSLLGTSLYTFIFEKSYRRSYFSYDLFFSLIVVYVIVLMAFGLLYFVLSFHGVILIQTNAGVEDVTTLSLLGDSLYFSGVTLLTIGYGDIIPVGWGKLLAITEALIGYLLPVAVYLKIFLTPPKE